MAEIFKCKEPGCGGSVDANDFAALRTGGCSISSLAYACQKCHRLHRDDGELVFAADGQALFVNPFGKVVKGGQR